MKKLILGLFAMGMFAIAPATSVASNSNMVAANCPEGVKKADPKAFTDKLVKDLKLDKKQAKALLKLNTEYAEVLVCPHAKGKAKSDCKEGMSHKMGDSRKAAGCCKESNGNCKKGTDSCKKLPAIARRAKATIATSKVNLNAKAKVVNAISRRSQNAKAKVTIAISRRSPNARAKATIAISKISLNAREKVANAISRRSLSACNVQMI
ncbi:hypothetical protein [Prevotella falsenii]|uniref:hypothetical protein n=1 Tax=Prevotella falsenii TaxID=515414 RepID=UPI000AB9E9EC|nr:hypothetical protein [Prevotella falsenii]